MVREAGLPVALEVVVRSEWAVVLRAQGAMWVLGLEQVLWARSVPEPEPPVESGFVAKSERMAVLKARVAMSLPGLVLAQALKTLTAPEAELPMASEAAVKPGRAAAS